MGYIIRIAICAVLIFTFVIPGWTLFNANIPAPIGYIAEATTEFLSVVTPYFQAVRGVINYFLDLSFGPWAIVSYNTLLKISLLLPSLGLTLRVLICFRKLLI